MTTLVWFRQDLRCADNPALAAVAGLGPIVPVYILDETPPPAGRPLGGASRWWLHHSLAALENSLGGLVILRGDPRSLVCELARACGATRVVWNRVYEPYAIARDRAVKAALTQAGFAVRSFNGALLHEPWEIATAAGGPFKVFTPFWRACLGRPVARPQPPPDVRLAALQGLGEGLAALDLLPRRPNWAAGFPAHWTPGERGALERLEAFIAGGLAGYAELRNRPDLANVSRLSPHLHFGEVSPRTIWWQVRAALETGDRTHTRDVEKFLSELGWREFSHHLLFHFPTLAERNWRPAFDCYPWLEPGAELAAWQRGRTGYPLVDAGMRELWATGYMHNRVRMVVASFLVKHLRIHWRHGEAWFWDTLVDADLANNAAGWQWVAGSGADAAPYFRIFNPVEQGRKFDPDGVYVRRWCPELARLPTEHVHAPFAAPARVLADAGVELGRTYPKPIVDHRTARAAALAGYEAIRAHGSRDG